MSKRWTGGLIVGAMVLFALATARMLPERVPTHWNVRGEADAWGSGWTAVLTPIGVALAVWLLARVIPRIDPRGENYERFGETYWFIINLILLMMAGLQVLTIGSALGWPVRMENAMPVFLGLFFIALGNFMPRLRSNWTMGIRTPWTLDSDVVWRRTHRLGGWCFVAGGALMVCSVVLSAALQPIVMMVAIGVSAAVPAVASYVYWRREQREQNA